MQKIFHFMGSVKVLKASAGSGKTFTLAGEYLTEVIDNPLNYRHILAVTFTNKATEEMKRRIVGEIDSLASGCASQHLDRLRDELGLSEEQVRERAARARAGILHDYSRFAVMTIDKFFQRIMRSFIHELGIELNFNLELQTDSLVEAAANRLIEQSSTRDELRRWIVDFAEERIAEGRRWNVAGELAAMGREVMREGFTGVGVTRERLLEIVDGARDRAATIRETMQAVGRQAMEIIGAAGLTVGDFAYGSGGFASWLEAMAAGNVKPCGARVIAALSSDEKWYSKGSTRKNDIQDVIPSLKPLLSELYRLYEAEAGFLNSVTVVEEGYRSFALLGDLAALVDEICSEDDIVHISQTNSIIHKLVDGNDVPFIFEKSGSNFSRFMIDEFQDTSMVQWRNFLPLLQNAVSQSDGAPALLVGDVKQSIYRWRGGDWRILSRGIGECFESVVDRPLKINWRSLRNIVEFNNNLIRSCVEADGDYLDNRLNEAYEAGRISAECCHELSGLISEAYDDLDQESAATAAEGHITVTAYPKDGLHSVVACVERLQEAGYQPREIALLVRAKREGRQLVDMFMARKREVGAAQTQSQTSQQPQSQPQSETSQQTPPQKAYCYDVITQEALQIGFSPAAGFVVAVLRLSVDSDDRVARAIFNRRRGTLDDAIPPDEREFFRRIGMLSPLEAFEHIVARYELGADPNEAAYLQALEQQIIDFSGLTVADTALFVKWWQETGADESINLPDGSNAMTIITIHKAKGLQYRAVVVPFCQWTTNPSSRTVLWADMGRSPYAPFAEIGPMPVKYRNVLGDSHFAEDFYREMVYSHIDNINLLYVAFTRAREELHIMLPQRERKGFTSVDALVAAALDNVEIGGSAGTVAETEEGLVTSFGAPCRPLPCATASTTALRPRFAVAEPGARLRLRLQSDRYFSEELASPRSLGVAMHKIFEQASNAEDIGRELGRLASEGTLLASEAAEVGRTIERAFADPTVAGWFDGTWQTVRNESDIVVPEGSPEEGAIRRPDRVMISGERCVVVDYKFGALKPASHRRQMESYMQLLGRMGHRTVQGYIWYITLGEIVEVQ
ncbi:MAG: UvrD-helicase domain-containing protein [Rikenellaceae bacterium]|jgi:ATP-dependent exoDNAse (exonuclease V) beta subunit|nr:UvrD-helicase domain-containing protein [Rikenellaceae bacterium]